MFETSPCLDALRSRLVASGPLRRLEALARTGSTIDDLAAVAPTWPDPAVLVADHQSGGHGRLGRSWAAPAGSSVLASMLLRPAVAPESLGWLPLLAGLAVAGAVRGAGTDAALKWPNDVLVTCPQAEDLPGWGTRRKVAGILARVTPDAVIVGWGINVHQDAAQLPVPTATSLAAVGGRADRGELLAGTVERLCGWVARWEDAGGDAVAAGIAEAYAAQCATLGALVRVDQVGGDALTGHAVGLGPDAALLVRTGARTIAVHAGDVVHLRPAR